jgi:hypothetical protein
VSARLESLIESARTAGPMDRINLRDALAAEGIAALPALGEWLLDPMEPRGRWCSYACLSRFVARRAEMMRMECFGCEALSWRRACADARHRAPAQTGR